MFRIKMLKFRNLVSLLVSLSLFSVKSPAIAQIIPDTSLGIESAFVITFNQLLQLIQGGARRGENLFQSFQDFNIREGQTIILTNPNGVNNILIRVTGNNPSDILGNLSLIKAETINNLLINLRSLSPLPNTNLSSLIQPQDLGTASLFFLNPNGILFGSDARLNLGGSFIATTANQIKFADGTVFSANLTQSSPILTISTPIGLGFGNQVGNIINQSRVSLPFLSDPVGLASFSGNTLALIGGNVQFDGGTITSFGGTIEIGAVDSNNTVNLNHLGKNWSFNYEKVNNFKNIQFFNRSSVDTSGFNSGSIRLTGNQVLLQGGSRLVSFNLGNQSGGNIEVNAAKSFEILGTDTFEQELIRNANGKATVSDLRNGIFTVAYGLGDAGNITINTEQILSQKSGFLQTSTASSATGGDLILNASESINISSTFFATATGPTTTGNAGNLIISTKVLQVSDNALITTSTLGFGKGGNLTVNASDLLEVRGSSAINLGTDLGLTSLSPTGLVTNSLSGGDAGNLKLKTGRLVVLDGGVISTGTLATGNGSTLEVEAQEILLSGDSADNIYPSQLSAFALINSTGNGGNLNIKTNSLSIQEGATITTSSLGMGTAGNINIQANSINLDTQGKIEAFSLLNQGGDILINANSLNLQNQSEISVRSEGQGNAGNININLTGLFSATNSDITANANQGAGGEITLTADNIRLQGDSDIRTNVNNGAGGGGNITVTANSILLFNDSDILAFSRDGRGGNIQFNTPVFFGNGYQRISSESDPNTLDGNDRVDINASGAVSGAIIIPDLTFIQNSIVQLPEFLINPEKLLANSCISPNQNRGGSFIIKGSGGVQNRPGDMNTPSYFPEIIQPIPETPAQPWKKGDHIIEPQGVYTTLDGRLYLSRKC